MDFTLILMLAVLAVLVFFMFRNGRKRQKDQQELQNKVVPGARVMTNFGVFGTILSIDEAENEVLLETTPGTILTVHRQTIARVVTPSETVEEPGEPLESADGEPEYGERIDDAAESPTGDADGTKSND